MILPGRLILPSSPVKQGNFGGKRTPGSLGGKRCKLFCPTRREGSADSQGGIRRSSSSATVAWTQLIPSAVNLGATYCNLVAPWSSGCQDGRATVVSDPSWLSNLTTRLMICCYTIWRHWEAVGVGQAGGALKFVDILLKRVRFARQRVCLESRN